MQDTALLWIVDDLPSRRFPIYTRGNTGEVYPNVITPLCGSIVKEPIALGQEQVFREMGAVVPADLSERDRAVLTGCFGGYLYANLSIGRLMGTRAPGMKPTDADELMFGTSDAPPYRRQRGDRNLRATARLMRFMTGVLRGPDFAWLSQERADLQDWIASRPKPRHASNEELLATVDQGAVQLTPHMRSLLLASVYGGVAASIIDRLASKADADVRDRVAVGVGGVESAEPAAHMWSLAQLVDVSPEVAAAFDGDHRIAQRLEALGSEADEFRTDFGRFLDHFGSRGPDEWELASDTWGTNPDIALAAIARIRHSERDDPRLVHERLAAERRHALDSLTSTVARPVRRVLTRAAETLADGAAGREFAKGTIVLLAYSMRLALFELVRRAQDAGGPSHRRDCWLVTREELPTFINQPSTLSDTIASRRERRDLLQSRIPPFVFEGTIPDPHTWARRDDAPNVERAVTGTRLTGMGVSPGVARGRVRVIRDPSDPVLLEPGDVLVAPVTDPAWTPLFLVASAVVCDVGAKLSHAAIVARELGIPAVVSVDHATHRLIDGATVSVDGTEGTVTVIDAGTL